MKEIHLHTSTKRNGTGIALTVVLHTKLQDRSCVLLMRQKIAVLLYNILQGPEADYVDVTGSF